MFKKYFEIKKNKGKTEVFFIYKYEDMFSNKRLFIPTNNLSAFYPAIIDHTTNSFVFHANEYLYLKTFNFVLTVALKKSREFEKALPLPLDFVINSFNEKEQEIYEDAKKRNGDCNVEIFQMYQKI